MTQQTNGWTLSADTATGHFEGQNVTLSPVTWGQYNRVRKDTAPLGPSALRLPPDPQPDLPGFMVVITSEHGHQSDLFITPHWEPDPRTPGIRLATQHYSPRDCALAEVDAGYEALLQVRAEGQPNPGIDLLHQHHISVTDLVDSPEWSELSDTVLTGRFRDISVTVTRETPTQAANRHSSAVQARTPGTQLISRLPRHEARQERTAYWALLEDPSGPRLLGILDFSHAPGITGLRVVGELISPAQVVWNVCYNAENTPHPEAP